MPYAARAYNPGLNIDFYALGMILLGISTTVGAVNFVVTFLRMRAPGMSINRVPILIWGTLTASAANIFAVPAVSLAFFLLWMDRNSARISSTCRRAASRCSGSICSGCSAIPGSTPSCCRRWAWCRTACRSSAAGRWSATRAVALATVATMVLGFGVWVHHMFATGLPSLSLSFFSAASIIITVPSAVAVFAWIATIWTGRPVFTTAFLFFASFIVLFIIGGVSRLHDRLACRSTGS